MSEDVDARSLPSLDGTREAVATGVVGGALVLSVQSVAWSLLTRGPFPISGPEAPSAEMAVFVAVGVVLPAGGVALLARDSWLAGAAGGGTVLAGVPLVGAVLSVPPWQFEGVVGAALVLAAVAALARTADGRPRNAG